MSTVTVSYLKGTGDFRSEEVSKFRDEADYIITNPPFSLFRDFIKWIADAPSPKQFSLIGNKNAVTYKEIFPLIKEGKLWTGNTPWGSMKFRVPLSGMMNVPAIWFTNIEHGRRHEPLKLRTMKENLVQGTHKHNDFLYRNYDNYQAIEVSYTDAIPSDYYGEMGVPISFLDKYCPEQFEIIGSFNNSHLETKASENYVLSRDSSIIIDGKEKLWNGPIIDKTPFYKRIVIKRKKPLI